MLFSENPSIHFTTEEEFHTELELETSQIFLVPTENRQTLYKNWVCQHKEEQSLIDSL